MSARWVHHMRIPFISAVLSLFALTAGSAAAGEQSFVVLPPLPAAAVEAGRRVMEVNAAAPDAVLQLGLAGPGAGCGAEPLRARALYLGGFEAPVLVTAGAGDRMACAMATGDPRRSLDAHRAVIHHAPLLTHGRTPGVAWTEAAQGRPENRAMLRGGVLYVAASDADALAAGDWIEDVVARAQAQGVTAAVIGLPSDPAAPGMARVAGALRAASAAMDGRLLTVHPGEAPLMRNADGVMVMGAPRDAEGVPTAIGVDLASPFPFKAPDASKSAGLMRGASRG